MTYTKEQVITLADQLTCHPASRSIDEIEMAGDMLKTIVTQRTELADDRDTWKERAEFSYTERAKLERQRDALLTALESLIDMDVSYQRGRKVFEAVENAIDTIASVKGQQ